MRLLILSDDKVSKEGIDCICLTAMCIDSVMKINKKLSQVYLQQCKYKIKKKKMVNFSNVELNLNSDDSDGSNSELLHYIYIIRIISTKAQNYLFFKKKLCIKKIKRTKRR